MSREGRFAEVQHAENVKGTLKRIAVYFVREKGIVFGMLAIVIFGTLCGIFAPALQSNAIDIIAKSKIGNLSVTLIIMLTVYLLYSASQLLQGLISAKLSQRIVKRMREELFGKLMDLPFHYFHNGIPISALVIFRSSYHNRHGGGNALVLLAVSAA